MEHENQRLKQIISDLTIALKKAGLNDEKQILKSQKRNESILTLLKDLKAEHPLWGYRRRWSYLYYRQNLVINKKRVYQLIKEDGPLVHQDQEIQGHKKNFSSQPKACYPNHIWGTDMNKININPWSWYFLILALN